MDVKLKLASWFGRNVFLIHLGTKLLAVMVAFQNIFILTITIKVIMFRILFPRKPEGLFDSQQRLLCG